MIYVPVYNTKIKPLRNAVVKAGAKIGSKAATATVAQKATVGIITVATAGAIGGGAYLSAHKPNVESKQPAKPAITQKVEEKKPEEKVEETKPEETKPEEQVEETKPEENTTTDNPSDPSPAAHDHITPDTPAPENRGGGSTEEPSQPSEPARHWGIVKYGTPAHVETRHLGTRYWAIVRNPDGIQQPSVSYGADARYASLAAAQAGETAKYGAGTTVTEGTSEEVTEPYDVPATPDEYGWIYD